MIKIDLITGFLGSGKTTFLKKYAEHYMEQGYHIGIIENDFGAVNVDMMFLQDLEGEQCELESIVGGNVSSDWKRRFKAKLIAMAMYGLDRILVEPSGIYDVDLFFDVIRDEPADRWYEIGNIFTVIDGTDRIEYSEQEEYLLVSQIANAGKVICSRASELSEQDKEDKLDCLASILKKYHCDRNIRENVLWVDLMSMTGKDLDGLMDCGWISSEYDKVWFEQNDVFTTVYLMNLMDVWKNTECKVKGVMGDKTCGEIYRLKGFYQKPQGSWFCINAVNEQITIRETQSGQEVLIIIGKNLNEEKIKQYFE